MSRRSRQFRAEVLDKQQLAPYLIRFQLGGPGLADWQSAQIPDEWVSLVVPDQFQSRYYTVRSYAEGVLVLDVVVHESGLVTEWASTNCVGQTVTVSEPMGSFDPPANSRSIRLVGDLTAYPAMARIAEALGPDRPLQIWAEGHGEIPGYFPAWLDDSKLTWLETPGHGSGLAALVESMDWPAGPGYFWMSGESAQMRAIRRHLMRVVEMPSDRYDVMGYWRAQR